MENSETAAEISGRGSKMEAGLETCGASLLQPPCYHRGNRPNPEQAGEMGKEKPWIKLYLKPVYPFMFQYRSQ